MANNNKRAPVPSDVTDDELLDDDTFFGKGANNSGENFVYEEEFLEEDENVNVFDDTEYQAPNGHVDTSTQQNIGQGNRNNQQGNQHQGYSDCQNESLNGNSQGNQSNINTIQQSSEPPKSSSRKKVGIIVFAVLIVLAFVLVFLSKIKITHDDVNKQQAQPQTQQTQQTQQPKQDVASDDTKKSADLQKNNEDLEKKVQDLQDKLDAKSAEEDSDKAPSSQSKSTGGKLTIQQDKPTSSAGANSWQEVDGTALDYSSQSLKSSGQVSSKKVFLNNSGQLVYVLEISARLNGVSASSVEYYCGYDAFNSVSENENIDISYKKINNDVFAILGVFKK